MRDRRQPRSPGLEVVLDAAKRYPNGYADRITPLLVSPDLETNSGTMFNQKGEAILPSPKLSDGAHVSRFLGESEALVARVMPSA